MADFIEFLYSRFLLSEGVSIDTRTIQEGNLFFAISGPNFNANTFAKEALKKGASYAVVDDPDYTTGENIILAEDSLKALQDLAVFHRSRLKRPVLGITGSNGKTTTKELIAKVLSEAYIIHATKGNYNNHIGVPLTLLHIHPQVEVAIIEMGANHVGDIAELCAYASPTHGLITNIGRAHTETFGGIDGVIRGKSELFDFIRKNEGTPFINQNDRVLANMTRRFEAYHAFPQEDLVLVDSEPFLKIKLNGKEVVTNLIGAYNFNNIGAAVSVGRAFGVGDEKILNAIASYVPDNARSQLIKKGDTAIILDAYNANPDSMIVALESLSRAKGKSVAILGDMNELENPDEAHSEIISKAKELNINEVITVGEKMGRAKGADQHFESKDELVALIKNRNFGDATVLLKASRSIKLESILDHIQS